MKFRSASALFSVAGLLGFAQAAGCAVSAVEVGGDEDAGGIVVLEDAASGAADAKADATRDAAPTRDSGASSTPDASRDAGSAPDATLDAGAPATGTACARPGDGYRRPCGLCGTQEAVCEADNKVGPYGFCSGEVMNGCMPGMTRNAACGICGTKSEICQANCQWVGGSCMGEVVGGCTPGSTKTTTAGCVTPGEVATQVCNSMCRFDVPGPCGPPVVPTVTASNTVGATVSVDVTLSPLSDQIARTDEFTLCPESLSATRTSYAWARILNPGATAVKLSVWHSQAAGGSDFDSVIAVYNGATQPSTAAEREACVGYSNDDCDGAPCAGGTLFAGLVNSFADKRVNIPAGSAVWVYSAAFGSSTTGPVKLNVRTDVR